MSEKFSIDEVRTMALESGFKLKEQPNGEMDLNPYVFDFAQSLVEESEKRIAELEAENLGLKEKVLAYSAEREEAMNYGYRAKIAEAKLESAEQRVKELEKECREKAEFNTEFAVCICQMIKSGEIKPLLKSKEEVDKIVNKFAIEQQIKGIEDAYNHSESKVRYALPLMESTDLFTYIEQLRAKGGE